jgi:hypothetical protein
MPKQRRRKCSEPRCCWHRGSKGRTSEGEGLGARGPSRKTNAVSRTRFPKSRKKIGSRDPAEAKALRSSFLCLEVITPTGADGFLRPAQTYVPTTERRKNNAPPCRTAVHSPKKYLRGLLTPLHTCSLLLAVAFSPLRSAVSLGTTIHPYRNGSIEAVCGAEVSVVRQFRLTLC